VDGAGRASYDLHMRPFYEQFHYYHRPRSVVGDEITREFAVDFVNWHAEQVDATPYTFNPATHMTAHSMLPAGKFHQVSMRGVGGFFRAQGVWPDFYEPKTFAGMNILHALTMPMDRNIPADKLRVGEHIPDHLRGDVRQVPVVGQWANAADVSFDGIAPGHYFFKANHGSGQNIPVTLPCSDEELDSLKATAADWLNRDYGKKSCQWWYQYIDRRLYLEEDLSDPKADMPINDFKFHCINGKVAALQMYVGRDTGASYNPIYDGDLNYLPYDFLRTNGQEEPLPANADKARDIAIALGSKSQYCRVDLYLKGDELFLGELTYLPNAGRRPTLSPELDEIFCDHWRPNPPRFYKPQ